MTQKYALALLVLLTGIFQPATAQLKLNKKNLTVKYPFSQSPVPPSPDYSNPNHWASLPDKKDVADLTPNKDIKDNQATAQADVFYVYPTIYSNGDPWNADINDAKLNKRIEMLPIKFQATVFNGSCKVYIPRYRQAHIKAFYHLQPDSDGTKALDFAYQDVKRAFEYYLAHYNNGRPIIIAGHSQGSYLTQRLVKEFFDGKPLANQLVAAYLVGWPVRPGAYATLQGCKDATATGCFVGWGTFAKGYFPENDGLAKRDAYCVNPLSWTTDTTYMPCDKAQGVVGLKYTKIHRHAVDAQVHTGVLWINTPKIVGAKMLHVKNYHVADYNLFWVDVRANVKQRVDEFVAKQKSAGR